MLAKHRQSGSMTATADDTESAVYAPTLSSKGQRSLLVASASRHHRGPPTYQPPPHCRGWPQRHIAVACTPPDTLPLPGVLYERHPQQPGDGAHSASTYTRVKLCTFLMSKEGV